MNEYYTYAYLREDKTPYYIGKGKGNRLYKKGSRVFAPPKDKSRIIYLKQNLTEEEAFKHEIYMIDVFGRIDLGTGILHNRTDGGDGISGAIRSEETRRKISEAGRGRTHSEETKIKISEAHKGKTRSEEHRKNIGKANKNKIVSEETRKKMSEASKGENNPNYGKTPSEETKIKMSEAQKGNTKRLGKTHSEETRKKIGEASKGKTASEESRKKMSESGKVKIFSKEHRRKLSEAGKGKRWWNDGCGNRKFVVEYPGDGWRLGRK